MELEHLLDHELRLARLRLALQLLVVAAAADQAGAGSLLVNVVNTLFRRH